MNTLNLILKNEDVIRTYFDRKTVRSKKCWMWQGSAGPGGYGNFQARLGKYVYMITTAHIASWVLEHKRLPPKGMQVMHSCDIRLCVNPAHLDLGTNKENIADKMRKGRHPKGSDFSHAKLTEAKVRAILKELKKGTLQQTLADRYNVTKQSISNISRGLTWKHVPRD